EADRVEECGQPSSFGDLLDTKGAGKMVKAHPAFSGPVMTATFQMVRELGWGYFEKLAKQRVLEIQSSTDTPKKLVLGERMVAVDGNDYNLLQLKEQTSRSRSSIRAKARRSSPVRAPCSRMPPI